MQIFVSLDFKNSLYLRLITIESWLHTCVLSYLRMDWKSWWVPKLEAIVSQHIRFLFWSIDSEVVTMFDSELNSFLFKFHQLRKTGATAHLDLDTHAGQAWVMLDPIQHSPAPSQRHRSPSHFCRQESRRAAKLSSDEIKW